MIEKLPEFHVFSLTTLIVLVSYLIIAIIYYLFNKNKKIISTLISFIIIASCSTLYTYHHYNWNTVALSDIKEQLIIKGDSLTIKALPKNIRYKDKYDYPYLMSNLTDGLNYPIAKSIVEYFEEKNIKTFADMREIAKQNCPDFKIKYTNKFQQKIYETLAKQRIKSFVE